MSDSVEWVQQVAEVGIIQADRQSVDGKIAPELIIFETSLFHGRFARIFPV